MSIFTRTRIHCNVTVGERKNTFWCSNTVKYWTAGFLYIPVGALYHGILYLYHVGLCPMWSHVPEWILNPSSQTLNPMSDPLLPWSTTTVASPYCFPVHFWSLGISFSFFISHKLQILFFFEEGFIKLFLWVYIRKSPLCIDSVTKSHCLTFLLILPVLGFNALLKSGYFAQIQLLSLPADSTMFIRKSFWSSFVAKFVSLAQKGYKMSRV